MRGGLRMAMVLRARKWCRGRGASKWTLASARFAMNGLVKLMRAEEINPVASNERRQGSDNSRPCSLHGRVHPSRRSVATPLVVLEIVQRPAVKPSLGRPRDSADVTCQSGWLRNTENDAAEGRCHVKKNIPPSRNGQAQNPSQKTIIRTSFLAVRRSCSNFATCRA